MGRSQKNCRSDFPIRSFFFSKSDPIFRSDFPIFRSFNIISNLWYLISIKPSIQKFTMLNLIFLKALAQLCTIKLDYFGMIIYYLIVIDTIILNLQNKYKSAGHKGPFWHFFVFNYHTRFLRKFFIEAYL